jgi:hypothetical protein
MDVSEQPQPGPHLRARLVFLMSFAELLALSQSLVSVHAPRSTRLDTHHQG